MANWTGSSKNDTKNGTYYVLEKFADIVMDSSTYGGPVNSADGYKLNGSLLRAGLVDELLVYLAPRLLGPGQGMASIGPLQELDQAVPLEFDGVERVGPDLRVLARLPGRARA